MIAEQGTHGELIARGELYAAMWDRQREADEIAERLRRTREEARRASAAGAIVDRGRGIQAKRPASAGMS